MICNSSEGSRSEQEMILTKDLNINEVCAKMFLKSLNGEQKIIKEICSDITIVLTEEPDL
jgi:hypothetical protein